VARFFCFLFFHYCRKKYEKEFFNPVTTIHPIIDRNPETSFPTFASNCGLSTGL
jgi:hypothetical protein